MRKVTVIGAGNVGSTIAYTLAVEGVANEIVIIDIKQEKAEGEAMDISQGSPFFSGARVTAGDYTDAADSDIVIITSGTARKPGQTRLELAQTNIDVLRDITPQITRYAPRAVYLIVSNPVDVMTLVFHRISGIPESQILGSGTILDTARLRALLAGHFNINQQNVHAYVYGEHGDSSFVPWSLASVAGVDIERYRRALSEGRAHAAAPLSFPEVERYVRESGAAVIARKGATYYAVAVSAVHIRKCIFSGNDTAMTVSTLLHGEYGLSDICLSVLTLVGAQGVKTRVPAALTERELAQLHHSADCLRAVLSGITF